MIELKAHRGQRRGTAAVAVLVVMLLLGLFEVGIVKAGARDQDVSVDRLLTVQAFYAAEAGAQMAFREISLGIDEDGDGTIGSISSDGNDANDPTFGSAAVHCNVAFLSPTLRLISLGRAGSARREIESRYVH